MADSVAIIDYGMGNLHSARKALEHVAPNSNVIVTADPERIVQADRVVFPGVGAIRDCMGEIRRLGLDAVVAEVARTKPFLAVCVGLQSMLTHSHENGGVDCLDLFSGQVRFFGDVLDKNLHADLKVPHMGWNQVTQTHPEHPLWQGIEQQSRFYFVHSYFVEPTDTGLVAGECEYGVTFASVLSQDNKFAVQFHPEKSQKNGLQLLKNFMNWNGQC